MLYRVKSLIKKIISYPASGRAEEAPVPKILENVFNTAHGKAALLSYIRNVFVSEEQRNDLSHTNRYTTVLIAEILNSLGYNVDVVNYDERPAFDLDKYALATGLGKSLEYILENREKGCRTKVIWFGTGCNPLFSNRTTLQRLQDFYERKGRLFTGSVRIIKEDWPLQHEVPDWMIIHGSKFARSTYLSTKADCIYGPVFIHHSLARTDEEWISAKKHYLWFGAGGLIHKGLDLAIDAFKDLNDCHLHICTNLEAEPAFHEFYRQTIETSPNITFHGFINVKSQEFASILKQCAFVILPSAAEGNSPSVITCMANGGLIPVVTKEADVDTEDYGVIINGLTVEDVKRSVTESQRLSIEEIKRRSAKLMAVTRHVNSFDYFKEDYKQKLQAAIKRIEG